MLQPRNTGESSDTPEKDLREVYQYLREVKSTDSQCIVQVQSERGSLTFVLILCLAFLRLLSNPYMIAQIIQRSFSALDVCFS
jgi:hypothetical protein